MLLGTLPVHLVPLLVLIQTASVLSSPATHVYPAECAPPTGAITTPAPDNATTLVPYYTPMLPIERCCPQVDVCKHKGGFCALNWMLDTILPGCDFKVDKVCKDYGCSCCVKCSADKCSMCSQTGGNCRVKCRADEKRDKFKKCQFKDCHCCKKCRMMDECREALGTCATNSYECPGGTHASTGCCGGCVCCKPELQKGIECERKSGSYCSYTDECIEGYYPCFGECVATQFVNGLESSVKGYCCSPKGTTGALPGRMGALNYYMDKVAGNPLSNSKLLEEEIVYEEFDGLSPKGGEVQDNVEELVEDQIYDEVVPVEKVGQEDLEIQDNVEEVVQKNIEIPSSESNDQSESVIIDNIEADANIEIQNVENIISPKFDFPILEDSDTDAAVGIDIPVDLSDQVDTDTDAAVGIDIPVDLSDQVDTDAAMVMDSPLDISDQTFYSDHEVDESNEVHKPNHRHKKHRKHAA